ncbi:MAG: hypothetical protein CVU87_04835 [Firmicutes bacterium HGW-Firmicutes-12]|jgi:uncharacterized protein YebE (UPF0316 family)|nr:MAG: hypothetical protein CVU87_04835 [Firmicutes bacterium HGW-Firmicutes-12]
MSLGLISGVILIFLLNAVGNSLSTLKTIFLAKNIIKPVYIIVFLDAVIFFSTISQVSQENGFLYLFAFALGKTSGTWAGSFIENRMALGIVEISLYAKVEKAIAIADAMRQKGYSVTTYKGYGNNGQPRFEVNITMMRKEIPCLQEILVENGLGNATMIIRGIDSVEGKIRVSGA